ncbi:hypothetical protein KDW_14970 [Dictyobacter vulcani]|uniref:Uncharacterized protein n=1 Tax=Dictyobacter vulcani TaxID=2607529 RepID=A0A5J4KI14_9CHLR|nr:hypothetical protein KDW_14970 [Dictyobacter vulcani]
MRKVGVLARFMVCFAFQETAEWYPGLPVLRLKEYTTYVVHYQQFSPPHPTSFKGTALSSPA